MPDEMNVTQAVQQVSSDEVNATQGVQQVSSDEVNATQGVQQVSSDEVKEIQAVQQVSSDEIQAVQQVSSDEVNEIQLVQLVLSDHDITPPPEVGPEKEKVVRFGEDSVSGISELQPVQDNGRYVYWTDLEYIFLHPVQL